MRHLIRRFEDLDCRKLMEIYAESNAENAEDFFPEIEDRAEALRRTEEAFLGFLREEFFTGPDPSCWVLEEDGIWVSALRLNRLKPGFYYLEALETRPDCRKRGCASRLLRGMLGTLAKEGSFRLCDCVGKRNLPSLRTHEACGFRIVSEEGMDYLCGEPNPRCYGMEYLCPDASL